MLILLDDIFHVQMLINTSLLGSKYGIDRYIFLTCMAMAHIY